MLDIASCQILHQFNDFKLALPLSNFPLLEMKVCFTSLVLIVL